ncbi:TPA: hypothetical protein N0F65_011912 [Lagenidium giganteum]|nr:TPA: hypothetical protein N0F65_011912 [Lagenidium giganteum]
MKLTAATILVVAAAQCVYGHGKMTEPASRPVTARYRKECYFGLAGAGDEELQIAPLQLLSQRTQADHPSPPSFDMMNGCRGMIYEQGGPVAKLAYGKEFPVKWMIQAPHPGFLELNVVKAKQQGPKIVHEKVTTLKRLDKFAEQGGNGETTVSIPSSVQGCGKAGDCALQFYWHSDLASQTYVTCSDFVIEGGKESAVVDPIPAVVPGAPAAPYGAAVPGSPIATAIDGEQEYPALNTANHDEAKPKFRDEFNNFFSEYHNRTLQEA